MAACRKSARQATGEFGSAAKTTEFLRPPGPLERHQFTRGRKRPFLQTDFDSLAGEVLFHLADGENAEVRNRRDKHG